MNTDIDTSSLPAGYEFAGRYTIERTLGIGSMGTVYLVRDNQAGTQRALKILHGDLLSDETLTKRFLREAELMKRVNHPNVVRTYDVGESDGLLFFTMELVNARSLDAIIKEEGFPISKVADLIIMSGSGLEAVHALEIVHRDMKPANILVLEDGNVKITDFGVARPSTSNLTGRQEILGTPQYMAPEIIQGHDISSSADLYSFGVILYEVVTGNPPFLHDQIPQLMWMHVRRAPTPPKEINPDVPVWLNDLILRMMAKTPAERPASISDVVALARRHSKTAIPVDPRPSAGESRPMPSPGVRVPPAAAKASGSSRRKRTSPIVPIAITVALMVAAVALIFLL